MAQYPIYDEEYPTQPRCAECRVAMEPQDYDKPEAHAVNCKLFRKAKQDEHFNTGKALDKTFAPKAEFHGYEPLVARLVNKLRALPQDKKAALVKQLEQVLAETK